MTQLIIPVLIAVSSLLILILLIYSLVSNLRQSFQLRGLLAQRLARVRLKQILQHIGIPSEAFIQNASLAELEHAVDNCESCQDKTECDHLLIHHRPVQEFEFCPNRDDLLKKSRDTV